MEETTSINKTAEPNIFEFGKPGHRLKLRFEEVKDLKKKLDELIEIGFKIKVGEK